ncbi:SoxR reducing system RseC family protein [Defluviitalea phaphyphila]|uniref:SoxR reducing system RseC family protein n=1 Tax=Defluviitalea phaphyphila TaxID=1473580 RepID=UPI000731C503|nr:SoxR reducing system RseC family protein [Defluviitalea phaphyphila]
MEDKETGRVISIKDRYAIVSMERNEACKKCGACSHGHKTEEMILEVDNICNASVGDIVKIDLAYSDFLRAAFIMYGIPLIMLFIGFFAGYYGCVILEYSNIREPMGILGAFLFMTISFSWIHFKESKWKKQNYRPAAVEIIEK